MIELPTGTVTFLFTDIEGLTRLVKQLGDRYAAVLAEHQNVLRSAVEDCGGREIDNQGEAFFFAFASANAAVAAAVIAQRALAEHAWREGAEVRVRMGLHTGEPLVGEERYVGIGVHRAARIGAVGHGGQVLLSNATRELVDGALTGVSIRDLGSFRLKDIDRLERLYQLDIEGLESDFPLLKAERVAEPRRLSALDVQVGADFLGYRIEELIGQGGMGVVYRAYDLRLKRTVALKLVTPELALDERFRERFAREMEVAMSLEHPNVVPIHDAGDVDGRLYLAMRLVEGTDLSALLRAEGQLAPARALAICGQVANALDAAHAKGLVHRDVKPSNILLDRSEHVYLADFGLTRRLEEQGAQTAEGRSVGTPAYLAPEQIEGGPVDGRADVYSLACVLYECVSGKSPFGHGSRLAVAWAHMEEEPPSAREHDPELPEAFDAVIRRAMAKQPAERYPSCAALMAEAGEALGFRRRSRRRALVTLVALLALAVLTGLVAAAVQLRDGGAPSVVPASLVKIEAETNEIVDVIPVGRSPGEVEIVGDYVFVASRDDATLSRLDTRTGTLTNSGRYSADGSIASQGDLWLWVASGSRHELSQVDVESLESHTTLPVPENSERAFIGVGGGSLWVSSHQPPLVERWHLGGLRLQRRYPLVWGNSPDWPIGVAFGYGAAWIGLGAPANDLLRIDAQSGRSTRIPVGGLPRKPAVGFGSIWIATSDDQRVYRVDPSGRVRARVEVGNKPIGVAVGAGSVWVANNCDGTVSRIDPATNTVVETIETGYYPQWLAVGDGFVWVGISGEVLFETCP